MRGCIYRAVGKMFFPDHGSAGMREIVRLMHGLKIMDQLEFHIY